MIKGWCKCGAEVVQVGAVVVFIIIYLYLFLLIINSYLYISIFSSKIDFSLCESLARLFGVYPIFCCWRGLQKNGNQRNKTRVSSMHFVSL